MKSLETSVTLCESKPRKVTEGSNP